MIDRYTRPEMAALWTKQKKFETWLEVELNATDAWVKLGKVPAEERPAIGKAVADVEKALAGRGRVLLRYSGTEALCRVMVEAEDEDKVVRYARDLADVVSRELR